MTREKYEELKALILSGKGIQFEGRSAATVAELDWMATAVYGLKIDGYTKAQADVVAPKEPLEAPAQARKAAEAKPRAKKAPKKEPAKVEAVVDGETVDITKLSIEALREHAKGLGIEITTRMPKGVILDAVALKMKEQ